MIINNATCGYGMFAFDLITGHMKVSIYHQSCTSLILYIPNNKKINNYNLQQSLSTIHLLAKQLLYTCMTNITFCLSLACFTLTQHIITRFSHPVFLIVHEWLKTVYRYMHTCMCQAFVSMYFIVL